MTQVCDGSYPGKSTVSFLPIIDLNPSDLSCIYSTLSFIIEQSKVLNVKTPVVTFDQPLWLKATGCTGEITKSCSNLGQLSSHDELHWKHRQPYEKLWNIQGTGDSLMVQMQWNTRQEKLFPGPFPDILSTERKAFVCNLT